MMVLANLAYALAAVLYLPVLVYQVLVQRKNRRGWRHRFGYVRRLDAGKARVWIHAVSLGEVNAARGLVDMLADERPDLRVVVSSTTDTGYARACALFGAERVFRYPLDFSWMVRRALDRIQPTVIVLVELEVWFNFVTLAERRGVPVAVMNGRLTERSCRRLARLGPAARWMFRRLAWVGAQDETIAGRFRQVGVRDGCLEITGSVKWDTALVADRIEGDDALAEAMGIPRGRSLWVCGSTGPGEEAIILDAYERLCERGSDTGLAVIPRKPERFEQVAELIRQRGFLCVRRSEHPDGGTVRPRGTDVSGERLIYLGDTMGELRKFYSLASVVFVGRSLVPMGGSDPMEVAALAKPIIVGPHMENFAEPVRRLREADAISVADDAEALADAAGRLTADGALAGKLGQAARDVVRANQGATRRTMDAVVGMVDASAG